MMYGYGFAGMGGMVMMFLWVLVLGAIVWGVVYVARNAGQSTQTTLGESPLDVLKRRYAEGEIDREQFEDMRRALGA